jgi:phosphoserine aminotransferase
MSDRIFNFSAGPGVLPEPVLEAARRDIWNLAGTGIGVLEHSHRGAAFRKVIESTEARCRQLAGIPDDYDVLFLTGGASSQFFMVPMNLLAGTGRTADYAVTGSWSRKALAEARRFGATQVAYTGEEEGFVRIPAPEESARFAWSENAAYAHFTSNNTIAGTQWTAEPRPPEGVPLVCDASSDIFSRPLDVSRYGLIYAGAQKNLGPAGVTLVIVRKDLVEGAPSDLPAMLQYRTHAREGSLYNTPPTFAIYLMGEVFAWIQELGGLEAMAERNRRKAEILYSYLDRSKVFRAVADAGSRSLMNVCFRGSDEAVEAECLAEAERRGLSGLKGHRSVGGMRASIYNAFPPEGCERLVELLEEIEKRRR